MHAASEFLAAIFARFGYVGRPRRRANIRDELGLLDELRSSPSFGPESTSFDMLFEHINGEVASYSGNDVKQKAWGSFGFALVVGVPLAFLTYKLNQDGFSWISLLPGVVAAFLLLGALGIVFGDGDSSDEVDATAGESVTSPQ